MENGDIPDSMLRASSFQSNHNRKPYYARLGNSSYWISVGKRLDLEPWIQADLGCTHRVTGLQTEGNDGPGELKYWVEQIRVQVGMCEDGLIYISDDNGQPMVCIILHILYPL